MKVLLLILLLLIINISSCQRIIKSLNRTINFQDFLGINTNFELFSSNDVSTQIAYIKGLKYVNWIRVGVRFDLLQPNETIPIVWDDFDPEFFQIRASGLNTIVYFTGTPKWASQYDSTSGSPFSPFYPPKNNTVFANTLLQLAQRYSFVKYWQVWDKMNSQNYWPIYSPSHYNGLYQECVKVFTNENLQSKLSVGSLLNFGLDTTNQNNNMITDLSKLSIYNNYSSSYQPFTTYPESIENKLPIDLSDENQNYLSVSSSFNQLLTISKSSMIFSSEWGWTSYNNNELVQANYTIKRLFLDMFNGFDKTFIYSLSDLPSNTNVSSQSDLYYGLITSQLTKKQVYRELEKVFQITGPTLLPVNQSFEIIGVLDGLVFLSFKKLSTNTTLLAFYSVNQSQNITLAGLNGARAQRLDFNSNSVSSLTIDNGTLVLNVQPTMSFLEILIENENSSDDEPSNSFKNFNCISILLILLLNIILLI